MTKIILCGCMGHMGKVITSIVEKNENCEIVAGVDINVSSSLTFPIYKNIGEVTETADVVVDFSHPSLLTPILEYIKSKKNLSVVLSTTGYSPEQVEEIHKASQLSPVFYSRNMSLGVNLLLELCKKAAKVLGPDFDIEVIEKHHNQKIDAPSGTALMIAEGINEVRESRFMYDRHTQRKKRDKDEIGIHAVRGGTIVGEHEVIFAGNQELISISHSAQSKELFAYGAVNAAIFMDGKATGLYDMSGLI